MRHRKKLRLLTLSMGAVALLLSCSAGGLSGDPATASLARGSVPPMTGVADPTTGSATADLDPTTYAHTSRVETTRPASIDAASPDPTGLSPSVEFSASEATPSSAHSRASPSPSARLRGPVPEARAGFDTFALAPTEDPTLAIEDVVVAEGNASTVDAGFIVTLSAASAAKVAVDYATAGVSATSDEDFESSSGTLTFDPGDMSEPIPVTVKGDLLDEDDETLMVTLSAPVRATLGDAHGTGTISDDDEMPQLTINDVTVNEGNTGTTNATFIVTLSPFSGRAVTVDYATGNNTAAAPADYATRSGSFTFAAGQTTKTVTVPVNGDLFDEGTETYFLNLSNADSATIADIQGVGTILDDDGEPSLTIDDVAVAEGDAGFAIATFTVSLAPAGGQTVSVGFRTTDGSEPAAATAPHDYAATGGNLVFTPGQTTRTLIVQVNGDALDEDEEMFHVNLFGAVNATIIDDEGVGTITDDDGTPPPPPPPTPDTTAPGEITNVRVMNGDGSVTVTWTNPSDADFQRVSAVRIKAGAAAQNLPRYEGRGTTFTDRGLKNGRPYRYRIRTYDGARNASAGVEVAALPKAALFGPPKGAAITSPPTLRWKTVPGATYYNVQLYLVRPGRAIKVLSAWPTATSYKLRRTWRFGGKTRRLTAGSYRWYVWPGLAKRSAKRYGPMVGESTFTVKARKATKRR